MIKLSKSIRRFLARHGSNIGYYTSRNRLDKRIAELFSYKKNGVFIEAGAADGFIESHTLFLEKNYGWTGLLVEPTPEQFNYLAQLSEILAHIQKDKFCL